MRSVDVIERSLEHARKRRVDWERQTVQLVTELAVARAAERRVEVESWGGAKIEFSINGFAPLHLQIRGSSHRRAEDCNLDPSAGRALKEFFNKNF